MKKNSVFNFIRIMIHRSNVWKMNFDSVYVSVSRRSIHILFSYQILKHCNVKVYGLLYMFVLKFKHTRAG